MSTGHYYQFKDLAVSWLTGMFFGFVVGGLLGDRLSKYEAVKAGAAEYRIVDGTKKEFFWLGNKKGKDE